MYVHTTLSKYFPASFSYAKVPESAARAPGFKSLPKSERLRRAFKMQ